MNVVKSRYLETTDLGKQRFCISFFLFLTAMNLSSPSKVLLYCAGEIWQGFFSELKMYLSYLLYGSKGCLLASSPDV